MCIIRIIQGAIKVLSVKASSPASLFAVEVHDERVRVTDLDNSSRSDAQSLLASKAVFTRASLLSRVITYESKLVSKVHVNALVSSYLQDLEPLLTSRYLQDELVSKGLDLVSKSNTFARNSYARLFLPGDGLLLF